MDVLVAVAEAAIGSWQYWIGDPVVPLVLGPLVWQLGGVLMIWICKRSLRGPGR